MGTVEGHGQDAPSARERLRSRDLAVKVFVAGVTFVALFRINRSAAVVGAMLSPVVSDLATDYVERHQWSVRRLRRGSAAVAVIGREEQAYAARRRRGGTTGGGMPGPLLAGLAAIAAVVGGVALAQGVTGGAPAPPARPTGSTTTVTTFSGGGHPRDHGHHRVIAVGGATTGTAPSVVLSQTSGPSDPPAFAWAPVPGADGYAVYRDGKHLDDIPTGTETTYTDTAATPGTHRYQVAPVRAGVPGKPSAALVIDYRPLAPPPVTRLSAATTLTDAAPVLAWDAVPGADSYRLYRDGRPLRTTPATSFTDAKATAGPHAYLVTVIVGGTEGKPSNSVSVDYEPVLPAPTGLTPAATNTAAFTWTPVLGAVAYDVYRDHELVEQVPDAKFEETERLPDGTYAYTVAAVNELSAPGTESAVLQIRLIS
jgi:hypothetical protein